ncbi:hypothetical protein [Oceanobacillus neutriphilus]|uniref:PsbP C-terminal domain-containing protein n=1 Tax=Oceanobacillus neutriphilus TaxID=531815 RepID=A0ABQ2NRQ5_9BACI|nr:hypothetical protein [Oceanobacillus neutriphilus]GGP10127.1 hypothetical protein GCM10011346_16990 [Oceanobacillus neutriphilus]
MKKYMLLITILLVCSILLVACNSDNDENAEDNQNSGAQENTDESNDESQNVNDNQNNEDQENGNENDDNSEEADGDNRQEQTSDSGGPSEIDGDTEANEEDNDGTAEESYESYANARFGFSVEYPSTFGADYMPENGDGIEVHDDTATIIASGSHFGLTEESSILAKEEESIEPFYEYALAEAKEEGESVSYERLEDDWYVISYFDGTNNIYKKSILADDYIANLSIEYPADLQEEYETMVERVSETFQIP